MLIEQTLFGEENKVEKAIQALKDFEPSEGYFLAFSGGKDSVVVKALCDMAKVKYDAHYAITSVDPPELVQFIKEVHPDVIRQAQHYEDGTPITMWNLIARKTTPPLRTVRYCCEKLKETDGFGRFTVTGVRWAESSNRKNNQGVVTVYNAPKELHDDDNFTTTAKGGVVLNNDNDESRQVIEGCYRLRKTVLNPIIDWSDADVWEFIYTYKIPYCKLYDEGFTRLGCIGCPMSYHAAEELDRYPKYKAAYIRAFDKMLAERTRQGLKNEMRDGAEVLDWWVGRKKETVLDGQIEMFEEGQI